MHKHFEKTLMFTAVLSFAAVGVLAELVGPGLSKAELREAGFSIRTQHDDQSKVSTWAEVGIPKTIRYNGTTYEFLSAEFVVYERHFDGKKVLYRSPLQVYPTLDKRAYHVDVTLPYKALDDCGVAFKYEDQNKTNRYGILQWDRRLSEFEGK